MKTSGIRFFYSRYVMLVLGIGVFLALTAERIPGDSSKGTLVYKGNKKTFSIDLKYAFFIIGPDSFDPNKKIRRLIFTNANLESKIKSCEVMNCIDPSIEGIQVDLDAAPRILYWVNLNGQTVQYSGTVVLEALDLTKQSKDRLAGSLKIDASGGGGPTVDVTFDAGLLKTFAKHR